MGQIAGLQRLLITPSGVVDLQSIRDENSTDPEYHAFISLGDDNGQKAVYMIVKIDAPSGLSVLTYHVGHDSGRPNAVLFETAWTGRVGLIYVRYDKIIQQFFTP